MHPQCGIRSVFFNLWDCLTLIFISFWLWFVAVWQFFTQFLLSNGKDLSEDRILITGAGSGIGRLLCFEFAKYCPNIVGLDVNSETLQVTARMLQQKMGILMRTYTCDLRSMEQTQQIAERILREAGRITILVNNAGIVNGEYLLDLKLQQIEDCFKVNALSHFCLVKAFLPGMMGRNKSNDLTSRPTSEGDVTVDAISTDLSPRGHLVTIASLASVTTAPGLSDYCSSKAAAAAFAESLEVELSKMGLSEAIHVTCVLPYIINTDMFRGCISTRPWLFPNLDPEDTVIRIVRSVRRNQQILYIGRRCYILPLLKHLLPFNCIKKLCEFAGVYDFVDQLKASRAAAAKKIDDKYDWSSHLNENSS